MDLKPENIFMECNGGDIRVFIGDFGISMDALTSTTRWGGTDGYWAPEVENVKNKISPRYIPVYADLYSMAVVLGEVLGTQYASMVENVKNAQPKDRNMHQWWKM